MLDNNPKVLVVFSSKSGEVDEHQRMLDMLLGHFTDNIIFKASSQVNEDDLDKVDYLFYYGQQKEVLPRALVDIISNYEGTMVSIGYNADQFEERFAFVEWLSTNAVIEQVTLPNLGKNFPFNPQLIINTNLAVDYETETLLLGKNKNQRFPMFVKNQNNYYFASSLLKPPFSLVFAEVLHEVFVEEPLTNFGEHPGYIRLEDVHPMVDPKEVMAIAEILSEKNIPYMVAVIPVYTNPETKKQYHFSDFPELLKALKFMQDNGGSIVLHGYTHQFRLSETGEGFEFWDVEHNMPIYHEQDAEVIIKIKEDFDTEEEYQQYLSSQKAYERNYIEGRLTRGIQELANYGLYPLAFEAPHYTMSQHGYQVASEYFTTYVGQTQLSDHDWEIMTASPYITHPTFLHGMKLLPETIGYVKPEDPQAIEKMVQSAEDYKFVRNGMVAGFFHPYLGVELFNEFIEEIEKIPDVTWIDLKQIDNRVHTDYVDIRSEEGEIIVDINHSGLFMSSWGYLNYHLKVILTRVLWCLAGIGGLAILTFIFYVIINSKDRAKRGDQVG